MLLNKNFPSWYDLIKDAGSKVTPTSFDRSIDFSTEKNEINCIQASSSEYPIVFLAKVSTNPSIPTLLHNPVMVHNRDEDGSFIPKVGVHDGVLAHTPSQVL